MRETPVPQKSRRHWKPDPMGEPRNAFQVYLLCVVLLTGVLSLAGVSTSGAVQSELPQWARSVWGAVLTVGSAAVLTGMYWPGDNALSGLLLKRFGLASLAVGATIYAVVVGVANGLSATLVVLTTLGFAAASAWQAWRVEKRVRSLIDKPA